jgi:hypothetical protein
VTGTKPLQVQVARPAADRASPRQSGDSPRTAGVQAANEADAEGSRIAHSVSVMSLGKSSSTLAYCRRVISIHMRPTVVVSQQRLNHMPLILHNLFFGQHLT